MQVLKMFCDRDLGKHDFLLNFAIEMNYSDMPILKENKQYCYALEMVVRDYEIDSQGIVNNAVYLHYFEHTRHSFCAAAGTSFGELQRRGIDPVVRKIEVDYLSSLHVGDEFISLLRVQRKGARFIFYQDIMFPSGEYAARGVVTVVSIKNGRLSRGDELASLFSEFMK